MRSAVNFATYWLEVFGMKTESQFLKSMNMHRFCLGEFGKKDFKSSLRGCEIRDFETYI